MQRNSVDLPAPLGPIRATVCPASIRRLMSVQDRAVAEALGDVGDFYVHGVYRPFPQRRSR